MRRSLISRFAALLIAVPVGLSGPALALAHGHAHHEAREHAEHDRDHHPGASSGVGEALHAEWLASIQAPSETQDHTHPQLTLAMSVRVDAPFFVLPAIPAILPNEIVFVSTASLLLIAAPARAGPADAPPRQPRAPPLG